MKESRSRFDISSAGLHILGMVIMLMDHTWATIATNHEWLTWVGRIGSFVMTGIYSCLLMIPLYPVIYKIGLIGGNTWKE